ncbi:serine protease inhibitor Kazal-type 6 [Ursus americanus]|uniref:serine protease inhibitor Kazal-type 6 n=1 Tax=Ursus americanus TaxID=9643 RepID=UPI001E679665|nr:serine protease inhibitor Kazal-type 6 [Ursus americanus]
MGYEGSVDGGAKAVRREAWGCRILPILLFAHWKTTLFGFCAFFSGVFSQGEQIDCGEFRDPKVYCTRESNPHCGSDGQTYGNKCAFCKAMVKSGGKINLKHQGKC